MTPMSHSNFSHGFGGGLTVRGLPVINTYSGNVVWVDSGGSSNGAGTFQRPYTSLETAINAASAGDTIYIKAGHAESIASATALNFDKAGLTIIGLGQGGRRPTFTFTTANTAKIPVSAANITIQNCLFVANFADVATAFLLTTAQDFAVINCEFRDTSSILNFVAIVTTTVSVVANGLVFSGNTVRLLGTTAATTPIKIAGTHDRVTINDNLFIEAAVANTSAVLAHGALVVTNLEMSRNKVFRLGDTASGAALITTSSTTNTGMVCDNYVKVTDAAGILLVTAGSIYGMFNNLVSGAADTSGFVLPAIDTDS